VDRLQSPARDGFFVEVKSRTWSRRDAEDKAAIVTDLLKLLGAEAADAITADYVDL
jgi:5-methylthioadenosine/S-adenosylhomocysteine deaminase